MHAVHILERSHQFVLLASHFSENPNINFIPRVAFIRSNNKTANTSMVFADSVNVARRLSTKVEPDFAQESLVGEFVGK